MITTSLFQLFSAYPEPVALPPSPFMTEPLHLAKPSKTRRKQASHDVQALGEALVDFPDDRLERIGISEPLIDAVRACRTIRAHEARRRQMQLIGKLMRAQDIEPVKQAVAEAQLGRVRDSLALHRAERWRAELLADDGATTRFATAHAAADLQQLRALVRNARKDASLVPEKRSGRAYRELFKFIREFEERA